MKPLQVEHEGKLYRVEFVQEHRIIRYVRDAFAPDVRHVVKSTYPYTTATLHELTTVGKGEMVGKLLRTSTVGCWHRERDITPARVVAIGQQRSLRKLCLDRDKNFVLPPPMRLDPELKRKLWDAYWHCPTEAI